MRTPMRSDDDVCWGGRKWQFQSEDQRLWLQRMAQKGWTVPEWPRKYGGGGLSRAEAGVLQQEMVALGCRPPLASLGIIMLAPAMMKVCQRRAEAGTPAENRQRGNSLVPGLQ